MGFLKDLVDRLINPRSRLENVPSFADSMEAAMAAEDELQPRSRLRPRDVLLNVPMMFGGLLVLILFLAVLLGPALAPENPYLAGQHVMVDYVYGPDGLALPPLPPSPEYPLGTDQWGNDMLSLLLHGARNTLVACAFITMVRLILGLILGAVSGWNEGKGIDRLVMGAVGVISSVPMLISSMILIYALDIRQGLVVFIVAMSLIGWTEIAQYTRSEFMLLRKTPYLEGARSLGATPVGIVVRHVLPNILPQFLIIACLEMAAVMMLLGELGFVGVFIGGGSRIAVDLYATDVRTTYSLAEIPEWGAMLATGFRFLRTRPYVTLPPALAFFISTFAFNTLGEGLRRLVESSPFSTAFLLRRRMLLVVGGMTVATVFIINNATPAPWFRKAAQSFLGELAYEHTQVLSEMDGRGLGQEGSEAAMEYIAAKFEEYGLDPGWIGPSYFYVQETMLVQPLEQPRLSWTRADGVYGPDLRHQIDFGFMIEGHGGAGQVDAPLTFVGFTDDIQSYSAESFRTLDLRGKVVVLMEGNAPPEFATEALIRGAQGILWATNEARSSIRSQLFYADPMRDYLRKPGIPTFRVRQDVAEILLADAGVTTNDLFAEGAPTDQQGEGWFSRDFDLRVSMSLLLSEPEAAEISSVLGFIPGSDLDIANDLVVVIARFDGLGTDPDGTVYPGANQSASAIGQMLELARLWQEQNLGARRSALFVAWGGEALFEHVGEDFVNEALSYRHLPTRNARSDVRLTLVVELDNAGAGGERLEILSDTLGRHALLFAETAEEIGVSVDMEEHELSLERRLQGLGAHWIRIQWEQLTGFSPEEDVFARLEDEKMQSFGEILALALTNIMRQADY
jgi:ABC-type dipeptide/oligopeptide/nickel transport system permease subunit